MPTTKIWEPGELTDQERAMVQLSHSDQMTMNGHIRSKLRMGRQRLAKESGQELVDDDMQILCRDMYLGGDRLEAKPTNGQPIPLPSVVAAPQQSAEEIAEIAYQRLKAKIREQTAAAKKPVAPQSPVVETPSVPTQPASWRKYLWPAVAALGVSSAGGMGVYNYATSETNAPPAVDTDTNTQYDFDLSSDKGSGFPAEDEEPEE